MYQLWRKFENIRQNIKFNSHVCEPSHIIIILILVKTRKDLQDRLVNKFVEKIGKTINNLDCGDSQLCHSQITEQWS